MKRFILLASLSFIIGKASTQDFLSNQLAYERVRLARDRADKKIKKLFRDSGLSETPKYIYWRAFKMEDQLELWASDSSTETYKRIKVYQICRGSGDLGPKRKFGDMQVPEGMYYIERYNPNSNYHLSMKVSYPNEVDVKFANKENPGNEIYVHGDCVSVGCIPMTDSVMQEIYWITARSQAYQGSNAKIPIDIFPCRFTQKNWAYLQTNYAHKPQVLKFWKNIEEGYKFFNTYKIPPGYWVDDAGSYKIVFPQNYHLFNENH